MACGREAAGEVQQFEALVEGARIRVARGGDRQQRLEFAEQFAAPGGLHGRRASCGLPWMVLILAVVGQQTEQLGQRPAREGVGGEAGGTMAMVAFMRSSFRSSKKWVELHGGEACPCT